MIEPLQLVVQAGEAIVCPGCGEELLVFAEDVYGIDGLCEAVRPAVVGTEGCAFCRTCGAEWSDTSGHGPQHVGTTPAPRIHLRSGAWTGWRGIGGE